MRLRNRTPLLAVTLASISLLGFACGGDDDNGDLDNLPTTDTTNPTQAVPSPDTSGEDGDPNGETPAGESPQPEPEGEIGGTVTAQGNIEGDFVPQSALATVEGDLQVLLASQSGESAALLVQGDGNVTMETYSADEEVAVFNGSGADVETADDGTSVCGVQLGGTELTGDDGGSIELDGELIITDANC